MAWQRYNPTTHVFEQSTNNGASWTVMPLDASCIITGGGGSNIAYTDVANVFTQPQYIRNASGSTPLVLQSPSTYLAWEADSAHNWTMLVQNIHSNIGLQFSARGVDYSVQSVPLQVQRDGGITTGYVSMGAAPSVGSLRLANGYAVTARNVANTNDQYLLQNFVDDRIYVGSHVNDAGLVLRSGGANVEITAGGTWVYVGTDAAKANLGTTYPIYPGRLDTGWTRQASWYLASHGGYGLYTNASFYLAGNVYVDTIFVRGSVNELGRSASMGYWIAYTPTFTASAGTWTVSTISAAYTLIGNTCIVRITAENSATSAANGWIAASLPYAPAGYHQVGAGRIYFPGYGAQGVMCQGNSGDPRMIWSRDVDKGNIAAYPGGGLHVYGFLAYQIG